MKSKAYIYIVSIAGMFLFSSCSGFSADERRIIGDAEDGIMKLMLTSDEGDSLFLRKHAGELKHRNLKSQHFGILKNRMLATVNDPANSGVGIAAPQIGISRRLIAVQRFDKPGEPFEFYANPEITWYSGDTGSGREGCLSIPGYAGQVERSREIEITYTDPDNMKPVTERIAGYTAIIFQHEIDHLDGILYTDKAKSLHRYK